MGSFREEEGSKFRRPPNGWFKCDSSQGPQHSCTSSWHFHGAREASGLPGALLIPLGLPFLRSRCSLPLSWPFSLLLFGKAQSSSSSDLIALCPDVPMCLPTPVPSYFPSVPIPMLMFMDHWTNPGYADGAEWLLLWFCPPFTYSLLSGT